MIAASDVEKYVTLHISHALKWPKYPSRYEWVKERKLISAGRVCMCSYICLCPYLSTCLPRCSNNIKPISIEFHSSMFGAKASFKFVAVHSSSCRSFEAVKIHLSPTAAESGTSNTKHHRFPDLPPSHRTYPCICISISELAHKPAWTLLSVELYHLG